jgi:formate dehydrogenase major subunit
MHQLSRRDFIKLGAAGTGAVGVTSLGFDLSEAVAVKQNLRIGGAKEVHSLCPYCAVGCSVIAYTKEDVKGHTQLLQIEGDPDSPVNEGRLCPKGATAMQLAVSSRRVEKPLYRAPGSDKWQEISWDQMLDRLAVRIKESRDATFVATDAKGHTVNRTEGIAFAGGATFSSEEGYFAAKMMRTLGVVHLEQQARV